MTRPLDYEGVKEMVNQIEKLYASKEDVLWHMERVFHNPDLCYLKDYLRSLRVMGEDVSYMGIEQLTALRKATMEFVDCIDEQIHRCRSSVVELSESIRMQDEEIDRLKGLLTR